jgi:taurine dioxygenase
MAHEIVPLSAHTGTEVREVDLRTPLDASTCAELNRAFVDHSVLVIRDQRLSPVELLRAMQLFGEVAARMPADPLHLEPGSLPRRRRYIPGDGCHTDHSNDERPPKATVLNVRLLDRGGDTQYVNMYRAYDDLPPATRPGSPALARSTSTRAASASGS